MSDQLMVRYGRYVAGWLDSSIHEFLKGVSASSPSMKYALITCLDSNPDPRSLLDRSPELKPLAAQARPLGRGFLLPAKLLRGTDSDSQVFFGFDEVWFFPHEITQPKPEAAGLVGPARLDQAKLNQLGKWLSQNSCSLALGDGAGLNFIVKAQGLAAYLLAHSREQPQPSVTPFETADTA